MYICIILPSSTAYIGKQYIHTYVVWVYMYKNLYSRCIPKIMPHHPMHKHTTSTHIKSPYEDSLNLFSNSWLGWKKNRRIYTQTESIIFLLKFKSKRFFRSKCLLSYFFINQTPQICRRLNLNKNQILSKHIFV